MNYDMQGMRIELIVMLARTLPKGHFYSEDYEAIVKATNRKTREELIEALARQRAINAVTRAEIRQHCII